MQGTAHVEKKGNFTHTVLVRNSKGRLKHRCEVNFKKSVKPKYWVGVG